MTHGDLDHESFDLEFEEEGAKDELDSVDVVEIEDSRTEDLGRLGFAPRARVDLRSDGRLESRDAAARDLLARRLGRAELLYTNPSWAVLRNLDQSAGANEATSGGPEVIVAGIVGGGGLSIIDFIGWMAPSRATGVVTVFDRDIERAIYFFAGDIVWASTSVPDERLGAFLVRRGKITEAELEEALRDPEHRLGQACVERGYITAHELWSLIKAQLVEILDRLLLTESGLWTFARISSDLLEASQIHLSAQGLLMSALTRIDEMRVFRERVPSTEAVVQRSSNARAEKPRSTADLVASLDSEVREDALALLDHLGDISSIDALMKAQGRGEYEVTRAVYHLAKAGLVSVLNPGDTGPIPRRIEHVKPTDLGEVLNIYSIAMREILQEMERHGKARELLAAARSLIEDDSTPFARLLRRLAILDDGSLDEAAALEACRAQDASTRLLSDALDELLFFVLFQATEKLGSRRGDDLARRVKMIHRSLSEGERASA